MYKVTRFLFLFVIMMACKNEPVNTKISGPVFGTTYAVIYEGETNYESQFDSLFNVINASMSTYIRNSDISKINRNESTVIDPHFEYVLKSSKTIYEDTDGAFDPTIGAVVNAWDFGPEGKIESLDSLKIDSLMKYVGLSKVTFKKGNIQKPKGTFIDFNAIAKGYAVDVIAEFLNRNDVSNYLVEIGGELRAKGQNIVKMQPWRVGLDQPRFDGEQSVLKAISVGNEAMATSGTYRKFKTDEDGRRYAHIIDTKTGYPSKTNILSVSVISDECMTADAYATAFQAMGIEKVKALVKSRNDLKVFIIFENDDRELETLNLNDFPEN